MPLSSILTYKALKKTIKKSQVPTFWAWKAFAVNVYSDFKFLTGHIVK